MLRGFLIFLGGFTLFLYVYLIWKFDYWRKRGIAGPKPQALVGNFPSGFTQKRNFAYDVDDIYREYRGKNDFVGVFLTRNPQLLIIDPKIVRTVLVTEYKNFQATEFKDMIDPKKDEILALHPSSLVGEPWKEKRMDFIGGITPNRIKLIYPVMLQVSNQMNDYLEKEVSLYPKNGINARKFSDKYAIAIISDCIFGIDSGVFENDKYLLAAKSFVLVQRVLSMAAQIFLLTIFPFMKKFYWPTFITPETVAYFADIMDKSIELRKNSKSDRPDYLNYLLQLSEKKALTKKEMLAHTMNFFLDGYESSSRTISHALLMIAKHKNVQDRLREEIAEAVDIKNEIEFEKLMDLPFLDQCVNETLRILPPIPVSRKCCTESTKLTDSKDKSVKVNPGDYVMLPTFSLHTDEQYWENPMEFIPDRFSPENGGLKKYTDMGVYLPFLDGPRICLGRRFALAQVKVCIVEIIKKWELSLNEKTQTTYGIEPNEFISTWKGGVYLNLRKID